MPVIQAFNDVKRKELLPKKGVAGMDDFRSVAAIEIGTGGRAFKADQSGIWLGANKFADAPFSVDMLGALAAKSAIFKDGDDTTFIDSQGLVSTATFTQADSTDDALGQTIGSTSTVDITGATLTITLARAALVLFLFNVQGWINTDADAHLFPNIGGSVPLAEKMHITVAVGNDSLATYSSYHVAELPAGETIYKLQGNLSRDAGGDFYVSRFKMSYIVLGK